MVGTGGLIYDYRLGSVRAGSALSGFDVLGGDTAPDGRIVTLGGYTTAGQAARRASWADRLFERFGGTVQIYNGCTDGHTSVQALLMLVRDALLLHPKRVACLTGFYNFAYKLGFVREKRLAPTLAAHPFATPVQAAFYEEFTARFGLGSGAVYYGEENRLPAWEYWVRQTDMMHAICVEFGLKYTAFLQPCVFSGRCRISGGAADTLARSYGLSPRELTAFGDSFREQYALAAQAAQSRPYIADLSALFDGDEDAFTDACHVRDALVHKIADAVWARLGTEAQR